VPETNDQNVEIFVWLSRLDTKLDGTNGAIADLRRDIIEAKTKAGDADTTANKALILSEENRRDIDEMKKNTKWLWTTLISAAAVVAAIFIAILQ
jgi:cell division protein FtsL